MRRFNSNPVIAFALLIFSGSQSQAADVSQSVSDSTYYNLANSYARAGKTGLAVLNYERAELLAPNDPDVEANLRLVREAAHVPSAPVSRFEQAAQFASPWLFTWLGISGLCLVGAGALAGFVFSLNRKLRAAIVCIGMGMLGATVSNAVAVWPKLHSAVLIADATPVRVTPVPMGDQEFVLPEAETVIVTAEHEEFLLIRTRAGRTGWIARNSVAWVVPQWMASRRAR